MSNPFRKVDMPATLRAGVIGAILFCVPVFYFVKNADYEDSWLLYLGSFFFLVVIFINALSISKKRQYEESTVSLVFASHLAALAGIAIACILCFLLLAITVPGYLGASPAGKTLANEPVNSVHDKTNGLSFKIFIAATFINFSVGSFASIIVPFAAKRNQRKDQKDPAPLHQHGSK